MSEAPPRLPSPGSRLARLILSTEPFQARRIQRNLTAAGVYIVCCALLDWSARVERFAIDRGHADLLIAWMLTGVAVFYVVLRTGYNRRFRDSSLTVPQMVFAIISICGAYAVTHVVRAAILPLFELVLVFGMFALSPRQSRRLGRFAVAALALTMLAMQVARPGAYPITEEFLCFALATTIVWTLSYLAAQLTTMRKTLITQRAELLDAMRRIQDMAMRDELTRLYNRRHMRELLKARGDQRRGVPGRIVVALLDIDHFKRINDEHGHGIGDEVLDGFARLAERVLRQGDAIGRWGGEEFLVVFRDADTESARHGLERLRSALRHASVSPSVPDLRISFSAGLACRQAGGDHESLLAEADAALYEAKSSGRDRIVVVPLDRRPVAPAQAG